MPAASLTKVDTTSQSWLVLPKTQGITGYRCVCLSRAAQLQSWGLAVSLVSLSQACCLHRRHSCATSAFCAIEAVHRKVCWLTCCVRKDRRLNTDLRFALAPKLVPVAGPTVTYGPYCSQQRRPGQTDQGMTHSTRITCRARSDVCANSPSHSVPDRTVAVPYCQLHAASKYTLRCCYQMCTSPTVSLPFLRSRVRNT